MMSIKNPGRLNPSERCLTVMGVYYLMRCGPQGFSLCRQIIIICNPRGFDHVFLLSYLEVLFW